MILLKIFDKQNMSYIKQYKPSNQISLNLKELWVLVKTRILFSPLLRSSVVLCDDGVYTIVTKCHREQIARPRTTNLAHICMSKK